MHTFCKRPEGSPLVLVKGVCELSVDLDDIYTMMKEVKSSEILQTEFQIVDPMNVGCEMLFSLTEPDFLMTLVWAAFAAPRPVWDRDFFFLSYTSKYYDEARGDTIVVIVVVSVERNG